MGRPTLRERILAAVAVDANGCWIWQKSTRRGYGQISVGQRVMPTHRAAYREWCGEIPEGLELDHLCRVPTCVNPAHLEPVTHRENVLRGIGSPARKARQTSCDYGHPLDLVNTYWRADGRRACKACLRRRSNEYYHRRRTRAA